MNPNPNKRIEPNEIFDAIRSRAEAAEDTRSQDEKYLQEFYSELLTTRFNFLQLSLKFPALSSAFIEAASGLNKLLLDIELQIIKIKNKEQK